MFQIQSGIYTYKFVLCFRENQGHISVEELKFVMRHLEEKMTEEELEELIQEADHDHDGQISYDGKPCSFSVLLLLFHAPAPFSLKVFQKSCYLFLGE